MTVRTALSVPTLLVVLVAGVCAGVQSNQSEWKLVKFVEDGADLTSALTRNGDIIYRFKDDKMWIVTRDVKVEFKVKQVTDGEKEESTPARFSATYNGNNSELKKAYKNEIRGIYKIDKDRMTRCYSNDGMTFPKAFESQKGSSLYLVVLERLPEMKMK